MSQTITITMVADDECADGGTYSGLTEQAEEKMTERLMEFGTQVEIVAGKRR